MPKLHFTKQHAGAFMLLTIIGVLLGLLIVAQGGEVLKALGIVVVVCSLLGVGIGWISSAYNDPE